MRGVFETPSTRPMDMSVEDRQDRCMVSRASKLTLVLAALVASLAAAGSAPAQSVVAPHARIAYSALAFTPSCQRGYYKNASGKCVQSPSKDPSGATAKCRDGTYSYSQHASGTCSHHGGVARWIHHP
jgi:hypothetical protein